MVSASKQHSYYCHLSCYNHLISDCWGKDYLILMEKRTLGRRRSTLAPVVASESPERSIACGDRPE